MAPNVRENIGQLDLSNHRLDAAFVNNTTLPKYLPLTSSYEEEQTASFVVPAMKVSPTYIIESEEHAELSYWDWEQPTPEEEKAKLIVRILKEEECRQAISTDAIIANLIAVTGQENDDIIIIYNEEKEEECYWDMPSPSPEHDDDDNDISPFSVSQIERNLIEEVIHRAIISTSTNFVTAPHAEDENHPANSYWDWTSAPCTQEDTKKVLLEQILKEESIRVALSIEQMEQTLSKFASSQMTTVMVSSTSKKEDNYWYWDNNNASLQEAPHVHDNSHPNHEFWNFPSRPSTNAEHNAALLQNIMKEESIRQILTAQHIQTNEITKTNSITSTETATMIVTSNTPANDCYWNWNDNKDTIIKASHVDDHTHPIHSYWDHPTEPITQEDKNAAIIAQILKEESIRLLLSSSTIEVSLKRHNHKEMQCQEEKDEAHSYWDW